MNETTPIKPGSTTSEFKLSVIFAIISSMISAVIAVLVTSGVLDPDQGESLASLVAVIGSCLALFVPGWIVTNYNNNRTALKQQQRPLNDLN